MSIFQNALQGFQYGNEIGQERRRRNALSSAGQMAAQGDARGGQNALLGQGYIDEANVFGQMGERQRQDRTREAVAGAFRANPNDQGAAYKAASGAALEGGDVDMMMQIRQQMDQYDDRQLKIKERQSQAMADAAAAVMDLPPDQRAAAFRQNLMQRGVLDPQMEAMLGQINVADDAALQAVARRAMTAVDLIQERTRQTERAGDLAREEADRKEGQRRWNMMFNQRTGGGQARPRTNVWGGPATGEQFDATNPTGIKASAEQRGRIQLSFGNIISSNKQLEAWEQDAAKDGQTPYGRDWLARAAEAVPFDGGTAARALGGDDYQSYETAARSFEQSILPAFAGSAVTESEAARFVRANQPRMGDSAATLAQKADNRRRIINAAAGMIGQPAPFPDTGVWEPAEPTGPNTQRLIDSGYMTPRREQPPRRERTDQIAQEGLVRPRAAPPRPRGVPPNARWDARAGEWVE